MRETLNHLANGARGRAHTLTVETALDEATSVAFYDLYKAAFEPLRTKAIARQVLHRDEFFAEMTDDRIWKILVRDHDGAPVGLTILTYDLATVPWISPEYFAARYPTHAARNAIFYLGFTLVTPRQRRTRVFEDMLIEVLERVARANAICGYDICAYNNEALRFADNIAGVLDRHALMNIERLDSQTYYGAEVLRLDVVR